MKYISNKVSLPVLIILAIFVSGCLLVSGTFVVVDDFEFTTNTNFYYYFADITDEDEWEDHKDDIDQIDLVGFEMTLINDGGTAITFEAFIDLSDQPIYSTYAQVNDNTTLIFGPLVVPPGGITVSYGGSFAYLKNVEILKELVKSGAFHFYGTSSGGESFTVEKGKVIITFTAHGS